MKLGTRARYSVRLMSAIARLSTEADPVSLASAAGSCGLSRRYMDQLMPALRSAGLLRSRAGRGGGYALARDAGTIRLREVVEAAIGPIRIADCVDGPTICEAPDECAARGLWRLVNRRIRSALDEFTLADLVSGDWHERVDSELASLETPSGE